MALRKIALSFTFFLIASLNAQQSEQTFLRRTNDHLLLKDFHSAVREAKQALLSYPNSVALRSLYLRALCEIGDEQQAFSQIKKIVSNSQFKEDEKSLYELLAWGVLTKGENSSLLMIRLYSLLGAAFTQDARAIPVLIRELRSSNAFLRSLAVKISMNYGDSSLKDELFRLLHEEKVWFVRLEVIQAIGQLGISKALPILKEMLSSPKTQAEEKAAVLISLVSMYDRIDDKELQLLLRSDRAGLRELACDLIAHLERRENIGDMLSLLSDPSPSVRISCLNALALLSVKEIDGMPLLAKVEKMIKDPIPEVSITASWLATILSSSQGLQSLQDWIHHDNPEWKRLASAALAATGSHGVDLSSKLLKTEDDIFVLVNLSLGLIGQRKEVTKSSKTLFDILKARGHELWMWETNYNPLFKSLAPSRIRHIDQIPRYPQVVDQHVKLDLLSILSIVGHPNALEVIKGFLSEKSWGIIGAAASTLIYEGDDQAMDLVRKLLDDPDEKIKIQAALILAAVGSDSSAIQILQSAYPQVDREMKMYILEAIAHIGDQRSIPFLVTVLDEPFQVLRVVAASALIKCIYH